MKSEATVKLEREIWNYTNNQSTYGCFEVTIGWFGHERVDYMTLNTKGEIRCYEIKVTKSDFRSKAAVTFIGHYNYYVLPHELYEEIRNEIPNGIGVYVGGRGYVKKPRRKPPGVDLDITKSSMIRSLCREYRKQTASGDKRFMDIYSRDINEYERKVKYYAEEYDRLRVEVLKRYGREWEESPEIYNESGRMRVCGEE